MEEKNLKLQMASKRYVHSMGRWYKFFAVVYIVSMSLMVVGAAMLFVAGPLMNEAMATAGYSFPAWIMGVLYLVCVVLMLPMVIYLMRAAKAARTAVALNNNEAAVRFLRNSKSYWKYYGIVTIVMLGIFAIAIPAATVIGLVTLL